MNSRRLIASTKARDRALHETRLARGSRRGTGSLSGPPMSPLGHSRPARTIVKFGHVRFAPKATNNDRTATCRDGPTGDIPRSLGASQTSAQNSVLMRDILPYIRRAKLAVALRIVVEGHDGDPETRGDPGGRCGRIQSACRHGRGSHTGAAPGAPQRSDRSHRRRA